MFIKVLNWNLNFYPNSQHIGMEQNKEKQNMSRKESIQQGMLSEPQGSNERMNRDQVRMKTAWMLEGISKWED